MTNQVDAVIKAIRGIANITPEDVADIAAALSANLASISMGCARGKSWKDSAIDYLDDLHGDMKYFQKEEEANSND